MRSRLRSTSSSMFSLSKLLSPPPEARVLFDSMISLKQPRALFFGKGINLGEQPCRYFEHFGVNNKFFFMQTFR